MTDGELARKSITNIGIGNLKVRLTACDGEEERLLRLHFGSIFLGRIRHPEISRCK
jgi:hypothetical protein